MWPGIWSGHVSTKNSNLPSMTWKMFFWGRKTRRCMFLEAAASIFAMRNLIQIPGITENSIQMEALPVFNWQSWSAFHSTKNSGNSGFGSEWNRHFPEFHSEILGVPREVGLKFRKIGITGKIRSIRPFLLGPSFSEAGNRIQSSSF